jgi:hypothetical protein
MCGYLAPFYYHNLLRGLEASLMDPLDDPAFTHHLLQRLGDFFLSYHRRMFQACEGLVDVAQVTDDLGSQTGPLIQFVAAAGCASVRLEVAETCVCARTGAGK